MKDPRLTFRAIYYDQRKNSKLRGHPPPSYTFDQLIDWLDQQANLPNMWDTWVNSNYDNKLKPTIDRVDENKPYTLNNIQLMVWDENRRKGNKARKDNVLITTHRKINAYYPDGSFYKSYPSIRTAARDVNASVTNIYRVANGLPINKGGRTAIPRICKGLKWEWA